MSKRRKNFKKETKLRGGGWLSDKTLKSMDDFFKEESERYRQRKKK